ncbi:MAG: hypothetical protein WC760_06395 [Bacteroidia bacterium]|jgi:hypothetical protein
MGKKLNEPNAAPETLEQALVVIDELNTKIGIQESEITSLKQEAFAMGEIMDGLNKHVSKLESGAKASSAKLTVDIGRDTYTINSGARVGGKKYSAQDLAENIDAARSILKIEGQQILTLKEGGSK